MSLEFCDALSFVQSLTPTWCTTQQVVLAELLCGHTRAPHIVLVRHCTGLAAWAGCQ